MVREANTQELLMLADGVPSQVEAIKRMTTRSYYGLMEFVLKKKVQESNASNG